MKQISDRQCNIIMHKLPAIIRLAREAVQPKSLKQIEDIRQLWLVYRQLNRKFNNPKKQTL